MWTGRPPLSAAPVWAFDSGVTRREKLALVWDTVSYVLCLGLFLLCVVRLASGGFSPFIYAQF